MKLNKMKQNTMMILLISLGVFTAMSMSKPRYLMQEYEEEYDYTGGKPSTNTGAVRSEQ